MPTFGSLCSGLGAFDLGLERAGFDVRWHSEVDPYCCRILERHWPGVPNHGDITAVDWAGVEPVDLLAGGVPCQPVSAAGRQKGLEDPRWLWPHAARAVRILRPRWVAIENVPGILSASGGRAAQAVIGDLSEAGYDAEWFVLPASAVGAPHRRERVFIVAHARGHQLRDEPGRGGGEGGAGAAEPGAHGPARDVAHAAGEGRPGRGHALGAGRDQAVGVEAGRVAVGGGEPVAHVDSPAGGGPGPAGEALSGPEAEQRPGRRGGPLADPGGAGLEEPQLQQDGRQLEAAERVRDQREGGPVEPGVGEPADGPAGWLDRGRWPAPPGSPQWDWEAPRTARGVEQRTDKLRALGNCVVPDVAEAVGRWILSGGRRA